MKNNNHFTDRKSSKNSFKLIFVAFTISVILLWYFSSLYSRRTDDYFSTLRIQETLIEKTSQLTKLFNQYWANDSLSEDTYQQIFALKQASANDVFHYRHDSLFFWTTNMLSVESRLFKDKEIVKLNNGWYKVLISKNKDEKLIGFIPIKFEYLYNNEFLPEDFNPDFKIENSYKLLLKKSENNVWDESGNFLFSIQRKSGKLLSKSDTYLLFVLFNLSLIFLLLLIDRIYRKFDRIFKIRWMIPLLILIDVLILGFCIQYFEIPRILFDSFLFKPYTFASYIHLSIASITINAILILFVVFILFERKIFFKNIFRRDGIIKFITLLILNLSAIVLFEKNIVKIFKDSILSFQFGQDFITDPGISSLLFLLLFIASLSFYFLQKAIIAQIANHLKSTKILLFSVIVYLLMFSTVVYLFSLTIYVACFFIIFAIVLVKSNGLKLSAVQLLFLLILFSVYMSTVSSKILYEKEIAQRSKIAERLIGNPDISAELEFLDIEDRIYADTLLLSKSITPLLIKDENEIVDRVREIFAKGSWKKYTPYITICDVQKVLNVQPDDYLISCKQYFENLKSDFGTSDLSYPLVHLKSNNLNNSYIATFSFKSYNIYVELIAEMIPEGVGYTELFNDESYEIKGNDVLFYSFAKYVDNRLIFKFGPYFYNTDFAKYDKLFGNKKLFEYSRFSHLVHRSNEGNEVLIISRPKRVFWERIAPFSYFFISFSVFTLLLSLISNLSLDIFIIPISFKKRIQFSFTTIVLFSFFIIGGITMYYIVEINHSKNKEILEEKAHSVLVELEHKLSAEQDLSSDMTEYLNNLLSKFSLVFFSDINLYDLNGRMIATSRPRIIEEGLISPLIHPNAYHELTKGQSLLYIQEENIGAYNYLSAYLPFRNTDNELVAYLNLPYFARQSEIQKEITTFLVALVNIYLLLFILAIIIAIIISRNISKPLEIIRKNLATFSLGDTSKKIAWTREDELGNLIHEYNRMIDELGKSAELLAKSEREGAWREMAKQVAHEIKNPLTPMKLSVQYLKKMWDDKTPNWEEHLNKFTTTIIQQIDTLSEIASAFSDFAKMPQKKIEVVDIKDVILKSKGLFKEHELLKIVLNDCNDNIKIKADKNQLVRVFNNLIKNSIQSIPTGQQGEIVIDCKIEGKNVIISVKDNGSGIPQERAEKIFSPNFTTKSSGMGLGLSIVKNIIEETEGEIWFESELNIGTTFYIQLPLHKE